MNKKIISIGVGIVSVLALGVGGTTYYVQSELTKRQELMNVNIEKITKDLPSQLKFQKGEINSSLFSTDGKYNLTYNEPSNKDLNGKVVVNYHLEHGIGTWFGGDIPFTATTKLEGDIVKTLKIKAPGDVVSHINGTIKENGSISMQQKTDSFNLLIPTPAYVEEANQAATNKDNSAKPTESGTLISILNATGNVNFDNTTGELKSDYKYGEVSVQNTESTDKITLKNVSGNYNGNINKNDVNFTFKIDSLSNSDEKAKFEINGIDSLVSVLSKNNKQDVKVNVKANKINILDQKDAEMEFGYSVSGIDQKLIKLYKKFINTYSAGKEFNEKDYTDARADIVSSLKSGFSVSLDTLKFKNVANMVNLNAKFEIKPLEKDKSFAFFTQSKFNANLIAEGESAQLGLKNFGPIINLDPAAKQLNINVNFDNGLLKINNEAAKTDLNQAITESLKKIDLKWGFIVLTPPQTPVNPPTEQLEASVK